MNLIRFELKKALGTRALILLLLLCMIACGAVCYSETVRDDTYFYLKKIEEDFSDDPAAVRAYFEETLMPLSTDFERLLRAYIRGEIQEEPVRSLPYTYSGDERYNDFDLIRVFLARQNDEEAWRKQIRKTIQRAEVSKEDLLIFYANLDENSFAYRQQDLISRLYTRVLEHTEPKARGYGWDQLFSFNAVNIFIFLPLLAGTVVIFLSELGRPACLLRVSKKGRGETAAAKLVALLCLAILCVALMLLAAGVSVYLKCGAFSDPSAPMASFYGYQFIPYSFTVWEYLFVFVGTKLLLAFAVAVFCALICLSLRNVSLGFLVSSVLVGGSFLVFFFAQTDALKYLNFYGIACFGAMTETVRCVNVFRYAVPVLPMAIVLLVGIILLCAAGVLVLFQRARLANELRFRPLAWLGRIAWRKSLVERKRSKPKHYGTRLLSYEFRKTFMTRGAVLLLLLAIVLRIAVSFYTYDYRSGYQRPIYEEYMETLTGKNSNEKREFIETEYTSVTETVNREGKLRSDFLQGKVAPQAYHDFLMEYYDARDKVELIKRIREHSAYLDRTEERTGIAAHFLFETDWVRLFQAGADLVLTVYLVYTFSGVFADEYGKAAGRIQVPAVTRTAKNGRGRLFLKKCLFTVLSSVAIVAVFGAIDAFFILRNFSLPDKNAPLLSLEMFGTASAPVSLGEMLVLAVIVKVLASLLLSWFSAMLGVLLKNKLYTLIASFSLAFLPEILSNFGVGTAAYFSFVNVFQRTRWLQMGASLDVFGDWGYVLLFFLCCTLAVITVTFFARKEYCK